MTHLLVKEGKKVTLTLTLDSEGEAERAYEFLREMVMPEKPTSALCRGILGQPTSARPRGLLGPPGQREGILAEMAARWPGITFR